MSFSPEQIAKLKRVIQEGVQVKREIDDLNVIGPEILVAAGLGPVFQVFRFDADAKIVSGGLIVRFHVPSMA